MEYAMIMLTLCAINIEHYRLVLELFLFLPLSLFKIQRFPKYQEKTHHFRLFI